MSVNSASSSYRRSSGLSGESPSGAGSPPGAGPSPERPGPGKPAAPPRSALDWAKQRLSGGTRSTRRTSAAGQRAEHRLAQLGPSWQVVEWDHTGLGGPDQEQAGFLAIGPGGVYAVTVVDHGRQRVMLAGDVIQIHGRRPPYVARAKKTAKRASSALTAAVGTKVPVVPVLAFVGTGAISAQGLPTGCLVVPHRELDRLLLAAGDKISANTAQKLAHVANHPATWADQYRWYPDNQTASDKRSARR